MEPKQGQIGPTASLTSEIPQEPLPEIEIPGNKTLRVMPWSVDEPMKYLNGLDIRELGLLQEVNRVFFHPLGLAAEVNVREGTLRIQDHREDPEGVVFDDDVMSPEKSKRYDEFKESRMKLRMSVLGFWEQPR